MASPTLIGSSPKLTEDEEEEDEVEEEVEEEEIRRQWTRFWSSIKSATTRMSIDVI